MKAMKRTSFAVLVSALTVLAIILAVILLAPIKSNAAAATAVVLTQSDGTQTPLTDSVSTATYSWNPETATLTLNGWTGRKINANGDFNLHLKGTNTINVALAETGETYGLGCIPEPGYMGDLTVTADAGGKLNITGDITGVNGRSIYGVYAHATWISGELNVDLASDGYGYLCAMWGNQHLHDTTENLTINIDVESKYTGSNIPDVFGFYNGGLYYDQAESETAPKNVSVNVTAKTAAGTKADVVAIDSLTLESEDIDIDIVAVADNGGDPDRDRFAVDDLFYYDVGKNAKLDCTGQVRSGRLDDDFYFNGHMQSTTPANDNYVWTVEDPEAYYAYFIASDPATGVPLEKFVLEYNENIETRWLGGEGLTIPGGKTGDDYAELYFFQYIKGAKYTGYDWDFELKEGSVLPDGLSLYSTSIGGSATAPCEAGSVTIIATDYRGTRYDSSDDVKIEFTIKYDAWIEPDRYIEIDDGAHKVEVKSNASGTGWSYDGTTKTLTLDGYNGGSIQSEKDLHIHLKNENTITIANVEDAKGIYTDDGYITITADEGAKLNIKGTSTNDDCRGIDSYGLYMLGGELNIDIKAEFDSNENVCGIWGGLYLEDASENVKVNVNLEATGTAYYAYVYGVYNGGIYYKEENDSTSYPSAIISVKVKGTESMYVEAVSSLSVRSQNAKIAITAVADNGLSTTRDRWAVGDLRAFDVGKNVTLDCTGWVQRGGYTDDWEFNGHMQTTTPANNSFVWKRDLNRTYPYYTMYNLDGSIVERAVFAYKEELGELKYMGDGFISIPGGVMGDDFDTVDLMSGIHGSRYYYIYSDYYANWNFEIIDGELPEGIELSERDGYIGGTFEGVCPAGKVKIRATDKNTGRSVDFEVPYGAITSNHPVVGVTLNKTELVLANGGSGEFTATVTPNDAAYPYVDADVLSGWLDFDIGEPVNGTTIITVTATDTAGVYAVLVTTKDMGLIKDIIVYVREKTPTITIDYKNEELEGFAPGATYIVTVDGVPTEITPESTYIDLPEAWIGKTISIVRKNGTNDKCDSPAQELSIPERPAAPTGIGKTDASAADANDGTITGVDSTMRYQGPGNDSWYYISGNTLNYLGIGEYNVRYAATATAFASKYATVVIGYGELTFTDSDSFDIPVGEIGTTVSVKVSGGVSGGKAPYTYTITGPEWLSVNSSGYVIGTRPNSEQAATEATVTVTDADGNTQSITVNVGKVVLPHEHSYDEKNIHSDYLCKPADCDNPAEYYYSCECGLRGSETFTDGAKLGHGFTEKIEDAAHLKEAGADCQTANTYWYDCVRCDEISDADFYVGETKGDHIFGTAFDYKTASGHAHKCTVEGCDTHDTVVSHNPGEAATEFAPQTCTDCGYEIAPKLPHVHTIVKRGANPATCTDPGNILYYECTGACGKYFSDLAGETEITDKSSVVIPAQGHDYTEKLQNELHLKTTSDCKTPNVYWYNCSRCTACAKDDIEATDKYYSGTVYGAHNYGTLIDATAEKHTESELAPSVAAHYHCSVCDTYFTEGKAPTTLAALTGTTPEHTYGGWITADPDNHWKVCECGKKSELGAHTYGTDDSCDVCGHDREAIHTHSATKVDGKPISCTSDGWNDYYACSCGKFFTDSACTTEIANLSEWKLGDGKITGGHNYGTLFGAVSEKHTATELAASVAAHYHCSKCDTYFTEGKVATTLEALTGTAPVHTYGGWITVDPDNHWKVCECGKKSELGAHVYDDASDSSCNTCGYDKTVAHTHSATKVDGKPASCTADGWKDYYACSCGKFFTDSACTTEIANLSEWKIGDGKLTGEHSYGDVWRSNAENHWKECSCGEKTESAAHADGNTDGACDTCGYAMSVTPPPHTHDYGTEWQKNETNHWKECSCGDKTESAAHTDGDTDGACDTCGYAMGVTPPPHTHDYGTEWKKNETNHWKECSCGDKTESAAHTDGNTDGACDTCGYAMSVTPPPHTHTYGTEWQKNETNHWKECSCGEKTESAAHADGNTDGACDTCGYAMSVTPPPHTHTYGTEWQKNETNHWKECSCGEKAESAAHSGGTATCTAKAKCSVCEAEYGNLADHSYSEATCTAKAKCTACGAETGELAEHKDTDSDGKCDACDFTMSVTPENPENPEDPEDPTDPGKPEEPKQGISGGAIAGIVIGSVVVLGGGGFALFWFVIKKKTFADLIGIFKK